MATLLALAAALCFGAGDFFGGRAALRAPALATAFLAHLTGFVLLLAWLPWSPGLPGPTLVAWGAGSGLAGAIAALTLYPALAQGSACIVAPISALVGTILPVLVGLLQGERPTSNARLGIALALLAIVLVSAAGERSPHSRAQERRAVGLAVVSGVFIGIFLVCFERAGTEAGLWPLLIARASSIALFLALLALRRESRLPPAPARPAALASGAFDISANACFLVAAGAAPLAIVTPLANLYPAATVGLAALLLGERPKPLQQFGLVLALAAIALITRG